MRLPVAPLYAIPGDERDVSTLPDKGVTLLTSCPADNTAPVVLSVKLAANLGDCPVEDTLPIDLVLKPFGGAIFGL